MGTGFILLFFMSPSFAKQVLSQCWVNWPNGLWGPVTYCRTLGSRSREGRLCFEFSFLPSPSWDLYGPYRTPLLRYHLCKLLLSLISRSLCLIPPYLVSRPCPLAVDATLYWYVFYLDLWIILQLNYSFEKGQGSPHFCTFHNALA